MSKKIFLPLAALVVLGAGVVTLKLKPCIVPGPICEAHMERLGAEKDLENPYYLSFTTPWLAKQANILYPAYARDRGLTGVSKLELRIGSDGKLLEKSISESSGHRILDEAALAAADNFVFNLAGFGNVLFPYSKDLKIRFELSEEP